MKEATIEDCAMRCVGGFLTEPCFAFNFQGSGTLGNCELLSSSASTLPVVPAPTLNGYMYYHRNVYDCGPAAAQITPTTSPTRNPSRHPTHLPTHSPTRFPTPSPFVGICGECLYGSSGPCYHFETGLCLPYNPNGDCGTGTKECTSAPTAPPDPTVSVDDECRDLSASWVDSEGDNCDVYSAARWCENGGYGPNWGDTSVDFSRYSVEDLHAGIMCCACGGGTAITPEDDAPRAPTLTNGVRDICHVICLNASRSFACGHDGEEFESPCHAECAGILDWTPGRCAAQPSCTTCGFEMRPVCVGVRTYINQCWARCTTLDVWESGTCDYVDYRLQSSACSHCTDDFNPVCAINGATYPNPCHAGCFDQYPWSVGMCAADAAFLTTAPSAATTPGSTTNMAPTGASSESAGDQATAAGTQTDSTWGVLVAVIVVVAIAAVVAVVAVYIQAASTRDPLDPVTDEEIRTLGDILDSKLENLTTVTTSENDDFSSEASHGGMQTAQTGAHSDMFMSPRRVVTPHDGVPPQPPNAEHLRYYLDMIGKIVLDEPNSYNGAPTRPNTAMSSGASSPARSSPGSPMVWRNIPTLSSNEVWEREGYLEEEADDSITPPRPTSMQQFSPRQQTDHSQMPPPPTRPSRQAARQPMARRQEYAAVATGETFQSPGSSQSPSPANRSIPTSWSGHAHLGQSPRSPWRHSAVEQAQSPLRSRPRSFRGNRTPPR